MKSYNLPRAIETFSMAFDPGEGDFNVAGVDWFSNAKACTNIGVD